LFKRQPFARNYFEAVGRPIRSSSLFSLAVLAWVNAISQELAGCLPPLASILQPDVGINAHAQGLALAFEPIVQAPPTRARRVQKQVHTTPIGQLQWLAGGLCLAYGDIGKRHDGNTSAGRISYRQNYRR